MKRIILTFLLIALIVPISVMADPGEVDTIRIGTDGVFAGGKATVPVYIYNDENIDGLETIFQYDTNYLTVDTFSVGYNYSYLEEDDFVFYDSAGTVKVIRVPFSSSVITPGNDILFNLIFDVKPTTPSGLYSIDSTSTAYVANRFVTPEYEFIYPEFIAGTVEVLEPPVHPDSIWVDNITGVPGETVELNIYGYNDNNLDTLQLAFIFDSDNISFIDASFVGTRAETAQSKIYNANNSLRQFLITLAYSQASPLAPGTGLLAKVRFAIDQAAPAEIVTIDSVSYLNSQPMTVSLTVAEGDETFAPLFTPGSIIIDKTTAVGEDETEAIVPESYDLKQNYPNPFNPTTEIQFDMPRSGNVTIQIYNIMGQKVKTLTDRHYTAGTHQIIFNGTNERNEKLASGVYFYRLDTEGFSQTRKMTLIK